MERVKGIYYRKEGRWEARVKIGLDRDGHAVYRSVYAQSRDDVMKRRDELLGAKEYMLSAENTGNELNLLILGVGTHGRDVYEIAQSLHVFRKISFLDDNVEGEHIIGKCTDAVRLHSEYPCAFVAIGDNKKRRKYAKLLKEHHFLMPSIVSPAANISSKANIGEGVAILPQATVSEASIGDFCILSSNSLVNGAAVVGAFSHIESGGIVMKNRRVPEGTTVRSGEIYGLKE